MGIDHGTGTADAIQPGHEYTKANVKFAVAVSQSEPIKKLEAFASSNKQTQGKFTIGDEKVRLPQQVGHYDIELMNILATQCIHEARCEVPAPPCLRQPGANYLRIRPCRSIPERPAESMSCLPFERQRTPCEARHPLRYRKPLESANERLAVLPPHQSPNLELRDAHVVSNLYAIVAPVAQSQVLHNKGLNRQV